MAEWILLIVFVGGILLGVLRKLNTITVIHVEFEEEPNHVQVKTTKRKQVKS